MGVRPTFKQADVRNFIDGKLKLIDQAIIRRMQFLGEKLVNHARTAGTYTDQTGNLRNSVGYVIIKNGRIIEDNFEKTSQKKGAEGPLQGKRLAESLANNYRSGYCLIVVSGMNYSAAVESRGKDVLASAEGLGKAEFPRMVSELKLNIKKMR